MGRMPVLPRQKTLLGYARALARAKTESQVSIIRDSYRRELGDPVALEVLDLLESATRRAHFSVTPPPPSSAPVAADLPQQLSVLRMMRSAAAANGFHVRLRHVEIEIEKG